MAFSGWGASPTISARKTNAVANNMMAMGAQQGASRSYAGAGLSRGRGQMALDENRAALARANAFNDAQGVRDEDYLSNASIRNQYKFGALNERLQYDSMAEQDRMNRWDSRFGNLTTAWGALAGLLR
jgi:hypothetical protein